MDFASLALNILTTMGSFFWMITKEWFKIIYKPFVNFDVIWIIIPIWLNWFFAEFFQEKKGTTFGNAISNGVFPLWVCFEWSRYLTTSLVNGKISFSFIVIVKYFIAFVALVYGLYIIINGIKGNKMIPSILGRIRDVTYFLLMFTPIIYGVVEPSLNYFLAILIYAPIFYYLIELIDRYTPTPRIYEFDGKDKSSFDSSLDNSLDSKNGDFDFDSSDFKF